MITRYAVVDLLYAFIALTFTYFPSLNFRPFHSIAPLGCNANNLKRTLALASAMVSSGVTGAGAGGGSASFGVVAGSVDSGAGAGVGAGFSRAFVHRCVMC